jgi:hypothetical protein
MTEEVRHRADDAKEPGWSAAGPVPRVTPKGAH